MVSGAGRYEKDSDYGSDFSPKVSLSWKPLSSLKVRASAGTGFAAPSLPILTPQTPFSAESVNDYKTCIFRNGPSYEDDCRNDVIDEQVVARLVSLRHLKGPPIETGPDQRRNEEGRGRERCRRALRTAVEYP